MPHGRVYVCSSENSEIQTKYRELTSRLSDLTPWHKNTHSSQLANTFIEFPETVGDQHIKKVIKI